MSSRVPSTGNGQPSWGVPLTAEGQPPSGAFSMHRQSPAAASGSKRILVILPGVNLLGDDESGVFKLHQLALQAMTSALKEDCHGCPRACGSSDIEEIGNTRSCSPRRTPEVGADQEQTLGAPMWARRRGDTEELFEGRLGRLRLRASGLPGVPSDNLMRRADSSRAALARAAGVLPNASEKLPSAAATPLTTDASSTAVSLAASQVQSSASLFADFLAPSHVQSPAAPKAVSLAPSQAPPNAASLDERPLPSSAFRVADLIIENDRSRGRVRSHSQEMVDGEDLDDSDDDAASTEVRPGSRQSLGDRKIE